MITKYHSHIIKHITYFCLLFFLTKDLDLKASGGCTFADSCSGATNIIWCNLVTADNSACTTSPKCQAGDNSDTCAVWQGYDFGNLDECDVACGGTYPCGNDSTYIDPSGECSCYAKSEIMGASCFIASEQLDPICGTIENTSYTKLCIPNTYIGTCPHTVSITNINCGGGGGSLQFTIFPDSTSCSNLLINNPNGSGALICVNGRLADFDSTFSLAPGSCYLMMFDGNAQAGCTWNFNVMAPIPTASFVSGTILACTGDTVLFTNTSSCYDINNVLWSATELSDQTSNHASFSWFTPGIKTVKLVIKTGLGNCTDSAVFISTIKVVEKCCLAPSVSTVSLNNPKCNNSSDGSIHIDVSGTPAPYSYSWSNSTITQNITGLESGIYTVTVTDADGCTNSISYSLTELDTFYIKNVEITPASTQSMCDGKINLDIAGGVVPLNFLWSNGAKTEDIGNLCPGKYSLTVTDSTNCIFTDTFFVSPLSGFKNTEEIKKNISPLINVAGRNITIHFNDNEKFPSSITIKNSIGQKIYYNILKEKNSDLKITLPLSKTSPGIYFIIMENQTGNITSKFLLQ